MTIFSRLARLILPPRPPPPPPPPPCRLTEAEALAIAERELGAWRPLTVREASATPDGVKWRIATRVRGANAWVTIDDATGQVEERRAWGKR